MLTCIEEVLPMGPEEWERVADSHSLEFPAMTNREASSFLRRKFQALYNVQVPTGDPTCPPHIQKPNGCSTKLKSVQQALQTCWAVKQELVTLALLMTMKRKTRRNSMIEVDEEEESMSRQVKKAEQLWMRRITVVATIIMKRRKMLVSDNSTLTKRHCQIVVSER
jgi:hypothetical protein